MFSGIYPRCKKEFTLDMLSGNKVIYAKKYFFYSNLLSF